jgi:hypothetical protein
MPVAALQDGSGMPVAFRMLFLVVPLFVAALGLAIAAFPHRLARWRVSGADGTATVEPSGTLLLVVRVGGTVVAAVALLMAVGTFTMLS